MGNYDERIPARRNFCGDVCFCTPGFIYWIHVNLVLNARFSGFDGIFGNRLWLNYYKFNDMQKDSFRELNSPEKTRSIQRGYQNVDGLNIYYEIHRPHCTGPEKVPLVLIHGGGSTIESSFGRILPLLADTRCVIALELQAHGRTGDRDSALSFERDSRNVAGLLAALHIEKADIFGFSNGGQTALQMALSFPKIVNHLVLASMFYKREAATAAFWDGFNQATLDQMPQVLKEAFLKVHPEQDKQALENMFHKDVERMKNFQGWTDEQVQSITARTMIVQGNLDVGSLEHALEIHRQITNSELVILPGAHGAYMGALESLVDGKWTMPYFAALLIDFLDAD